MFTEKENTRIYKTGSVNDPDLTERQDAADLDAAYISLTAASCPKGNDAAVVTICGVFDNTAYKVYPYILSISERR